MCRTRVNTIPMIMLVVFIGLSMNADSAELPSPVFPVTQPKLEVVGEELLYYYRVMEYLPEQKMDAAKGKSSASCDVPESCLVSHISAMLAGDYDWWWKNWDKQSQALMRERDSAKGRTPDFWKNAWDRALSGSVVYLTHRVETGKYVILVYRVDNEERSFERSLAFRPVQSGEWRVTQELRSDPVFLQWNQPGYKLQRVIRGPEPGWLEGD